jgi:hypothetical protein
MEYQVKVNKRVDSLIFEKETGLFLFKRDNDFFVGGAESQEQAQSLVDAHNPPEPTEPTIADKLASVGLSLDELKAAILGGN